MTTIAPTTMHEITVGDTLTPLKAKLKQSGRAVDTNGKTLGFRMIDGDGTAKISGDTSNTAQASAQNFTVDTANNELDDADHGLENGDEVVLTTTGTLPAGLATSTTYWVVGRSEDSFQVSLSKGGDAVAITDSGSGTHSYRALGHVQYDFQSTGVDTAGDYLAWFYVSSGGETDYYPPQSRTLGQKFGVRIHSKS